MARKRTPDQGASYGYPDHNSRGETAGMFDPAYLIPRLLARWHWLLLGLLLGLGLGIYQLKNSTPLYRSTATLMVRDWNMTVMGNFDPTDIDLRSKQAVEAVSADFHRSVLYEQVASDPIVRELPDLIPPKEEGFSAVFSAPEDSSPIGQVAPPAEVLATMIRSWTTAEVPDESRFINVSVVHTSPRVTQVITNRLVHHFIELRRKNKSTGALDSLEYLVTESARVGRELQQSQTLLGSYSAPLDAELAMIESEKKLSTLQVRYLHKHPKMKDGVRANELLRGDLLAKLNSAIANPLDQEHWLQYRAQLGDLSDENNFNNMRRLLLARKSTLESEIESKSTLYKSLLERVQTKQVTAERSESEVVLKEPGQLPRSPFAPNAKSILMKASGLGLFAGLALAFLFQFLDNKVHRPEQVTEFFGLQPLAVMPSLPGPDALKKTFSGLTRLPSSLRKISHPLAVTLWGEDKKYSEVFRILRASVSLLGDSEKRKVTLVTSSLPGEGKTFAAGNLAIAYARQGTKTLLIDFDLRKPALHKLFGEPRNANNGIVNILTKTAPYETAFTEYEAFPNLTVVFTGPKSPNPGELLEPKRLEKLIAQLSEEYDHIIIDSAPLLAVPDSRILAPLAHNLTLVVRADSTPRKAVQQALALLETANVVPDGILLNDFSEKRAGSQSYEYAYQEYTDEDESDSDEVTPTFTKPPLEHF